MISGVIGAVKAGIGIAPTQSTHIKRPSVSILQVSLNLGLLRLETNKALVFWAVRGLVKLL